MIRFVPVFVLCGASLYALGGPPAWAKPALPPVQPYSRPAPKDQVPMANLAAGTHVVSNGPVSGVIPRWSAARRARYEKASAVVRTVGRLVWLNRLGEAKQYLDTFVAGHSRIVPPVSSQVGDMEINCDLLDGLYQDAYDRIQHELTRNVYRRNHGTTIYLELAMALAGLGRVYPGQVAFCIKQTGAAWQPELLGALPGHLSTAETPGNALLQSCMALGLRSWATPAYLQLALRLDPMNEAAAHYAVQYYQFQGRYAESRKIATRFAAELPPGPDRDYFLHKLKREKGLVDDPQPDPYGRPKPVHP